VSHDLLLSSGFLAFARHVGVIQAIEARNIAIDAVVGTSSGALVGALWAAGHSGDDLERLVAGRRPFDLMGWHVAPWRGVFSLDPLVAWLSEHLPPSFAELRRPFGAGVRAPDGSALLLTEGDLRAAVAASCAIPYVFAGVAHGGAVYQDGGVVDRLMVGPWRAWRGERPAVAHVVDRTGGAALSTPLDGLTVVRTPRSGASFWSLGDVPAAVREAREIAVGVLGG
jgi:predicted acylesterase/phospholipase RssA